MVKGLETVPMGVGRGPRLLAWKEKLEEGLKKSVCLGVQVQYNKCFVSSPSLVACATQAIARKLNIQGRAIVVA